MITPFEIENKEFSKSMRGYNAVEVDEFLDQIILDLEKILEENEKLKKNVEQLNGELKQYKKSESSVLNTLESAKKLMNDISESAEKRAEIIIRNAKMDAQVITRDARESVSKLTEESERLRAKATKFKEKYRQMLTDELNELEGSSEDLFADLENDFLTAQTPSEMLQEEKAEIKTEIKTAKPSSVSDTQVVNKQTVTDKKSAGVTGDTIVVKEKTLEEILMEDFGTAGSSDQNFGKKGFNKDKNFITEAGGGAFIAP